jgi:hypothetical protein
MLYVFIHALREGVLRVLLSVINLKRQALLKSTKKKLQLTKTLGALGI